MTGVQTCALPIYWKRWIGIAALAASTLATAQDPQFSKNPTDFHSAATIHEEAEKLLAQAKTSPDGLAQLRLDTYPGHNITLTVRAKSGGGEIHSNWSDVFIVISGEATVVTGGKVESPVSKPDGEIRGTKVVGGAGQLLRAGDVFHVSPGVHNSSAQIHQIDTILERNVNRFRKRDIEFIQLD